MRIVTIDLARVTDWDTFHAVFAESMGFPGFYGKNMDAWIDCMTYVDDRDAGMSRVTVEPGEVLTLQLESIDGFATRCPEQYAALIECTAFVNWRRIETGDNAVLALSYYKTTGG